MKSIKDATCHEVLEIMEGIASQKDAEHSKRVRNICKMIVNELEKSGIAVKKKKLYKAAYLHDIGKASCSGDAHPFMSVVYMYELFNCKTKGDRKYANEVSSIIVSHKGCFCPCSSVIMEAAILRMADKIDKFNKDSKEANESYIKHIETIKGYFKKHFFDVDFDDFCEFKAACKTIRKRVKKKSEENAI